VSFPFAPVYLVAVLLAPRARLLLSWRESVLFDRSWWRFKPDYALSKVQLTPQILVSLPVFALLAGHGFISAQEPQ
jgi:hypothetical protein